MYFIDPRKRRRIFEHIGNERFDDFRFSLGLNLDHTLADIAHEAVHFVMRCNASNGFAKEHALDPALNSDLRTLAHAGSLRRRPSPASSNPGQAGVALRPL